MQHLEVSGAVRHIYIYAIRRLKVNYPFVRDVMRQCEQTSNFQSNAPIRYEISTKAVLNSCMGESRKLIPSGQMIFSSRPALWGTELRLEHRNLMKPHSSVQKLTA